jgi:hypothetical protein
MSDQKLGTSKSIRVNHMMFQTDGQAWSSEDGQLHAAARVLKHEARPRSGTADSSWDFMGSIGSLRSKLHPASVDHPGKLF